MKRIRGGEAQKRVLELVNDPKADVYDVAVAYRAMLQTPGRYDWKDVNGAIIERWTEEGWMRMMRVAWQHQLSV